MWNKVKFYNGRTNYWVPWFTSIRDTMKTKKKKKDAGDSSIKYVHILIISVL